MRKGYVYLIRQGQSDLYKIGHTTKKPQNRLKELQTGNPEELYLITFFETKFYKEIENLMHISNTQYKHRMEWFRFDLSIEKEFLKECSDKESNAKFLHENKALEKKLESLIKGRV